MDADEEAEGRSYFETHALAPGSCLRVLTVEWVIARDGSIRLKAAKPAHNLNHARALPPPGLDLMWTSPPERQGTMERQARPNVVESRAAPASALKGG